MSHTTFRVSDGLEFLDGLWGTPGFPRWGWTCIKVVDRNPNQDPADKVDYHTCEACRKYPIRFVHMLVHDDWAGVVAVGRICAEHLTDDYVNPRRCESNLRKLSARRAAARRRWARLTWRISANGNLWTKFKGHHLVIFRLRFAEGYSFGIDGQFHRGEFPTEDDAHIACRERFLDREAQRFAARSDC